MASKAKTGNAIVETVKTVVYALLIAGVFRTLFFQPFWIPSGSMKETLLIGDFLFVNKMAYGYSYASCPSLMLPSVGIDIDAKDVCGFLQNDNKRLFGGEPEQLGRVAVPQCDRVVRVDGNDRIPGLIQGGRGQLQVDVGGLFDCHVGPLVANILTTILFIRALAGSRPLAICQEPSRTAPAVGTFGDVPSRLAPEVEQSCRTPTTGRTA